MTTVTWPPRMLSGETLLGACPRLRILATSREALDVSELEVDPPGTDPFGATTTIIRNGLGRQVQITDPHGRVIADRFRGRP
ncbi:hypothetical protein [Nocardia sp. NPDC060259]|uniref:hypothetical protein n=1 Tax=Nocardia sp. NPDC060259 TaxID=3347088 RepID=UPI00364AF83D